MLSERLQELEQEGIVDRTVLPETPVRVEYRTHEERPRPRIRDRCDRRMGAQVARTSARDRGPRPVAAPRVNGGSSAFDLTP